MTSIWVSFAVDSSYSIDMALGSLTTLMQSQVRSPQSAGTAAAPPPSALPLVGPASHGFGQGSGVDPTYRQQNALHTMRGAWLSSLGGDPDATPHFQGPNLGMAFGDLGGGGGPTSIDTLRLHADLQTGVRGRLAEQFEPNATIGIIDGFGGSGHGEAMEHLVRGQGFTDGEIQNIEAPTGAGTYNMAEQMLRDPRLPMDQRLHAYIEEGQTAYLNRTAGVLNGIADDPNHQLQTITESRGTGRQNSYQNLHGLALSEGEGGAHQVTPLGEEMMRSFGLTPGTDEQTIRAFRQQLADRVDDVTTNSDRIAEAQQGLSRAVDRLGERGISYVTTAGNEGGLQQDLAQQGVQVSDRWDDALTGVPNALVVGATDTREGRNEQVYFSSRYDNVDILAPGVNIDVGQDQPRHGTSVAAPVVAGRLESLRRQNPGSSPQDLQEQLIRSAGPVANSATPALN